MKKAYLWSMLTWCFCLTLMANTPKVYTLASYNIQGTSMVQARMTEVINVVSFVNADCVALQEVNSWTRGDNETSFSRHDWLGILMRDGGMNYSYFLNTDKGNKNDYGIGLLTKEKPVRVATKVIKNIGGNADRTNANDYGEDRGLIIAEFEDYYYIGAHFATVAAHRRAMVDWVVDTIQYFQKPVFFGGDFYMPWGTNPMPALRNGTNLQNNLTGTAYTYPTDVPNRCIDYIMGYQPAVLSDLGYSFTAQGGGLISGSGANLVLASDHLPIYARFSLGKTNSGVSNTEANGYNIFSTGNEIYVKGLKQQAQIQVYDINGRCIYSGVGNGDSIIPLKKTKKTVFVDIKEGTLLSVSKILH